MNPFESVVFGTWWGFVLYLGTVLWWWESGRLYTATRRTLV